MSMVDAVDNAQKFEELSLKAGISARKPHLRAVGYCFNCGEECHGCFCDAYCGEDYNKRVRGGAEMNRKVSAG